MVWPIKSDSDTSDRADGAAIRKPVASAADEHVQLWVDKHSEGLMQIKPLISGGIAGSAAKTAVAPLSRVTILMQVQSMRPHKYDDGRSPNNKNLWASLTKIVKEEGVRGLFRGNLATLVHRFPYAGVTFYSNSALREYLATSPWTRSAPGQARTLVAGGSSAGLAIVLCYPLDVVKTRLIAQTGTIYYRGIVDALIRIGREEGRHGFYRGLGMSIASQVPSLGINFVLYDEFLSLYGQLGVPQSVRAVIAGGSSGAIAATLLFPIDLVRRQMQLVGLGGRPKIYQNSFEAFRHVYAEGCRIYEGHRLRYFFACRELFRGLFPELLKVSGAFVGSISSVSHSCALR